MGLILASPIESPVTANELAEYMRLDPAAAEAEPGVLSAILMAATDYVQKKTGTGIMQQDFGYTLDGFPRGSEPIRLPCPPLLTVDSIKYSADGVVLTLPSSFYWVDSAARPGRIFPISGQQWPTLERTTVSIDFTAGYESAAEVPYLLKQAIKALSAAWYETREAFTDRTITEIPTPFTVDAICDMHKFIEVL